MSDCGIHVAPVTVAELREIMLLMREQGCVSLRTGDVAIVLGPAPMPTEARRAAADPDVAAEESADAQAIREYQQHLYGAQRAGH